jgi:tetratricopeptide (TPR) repeat protein
VYERLEDPERARERYQQALRLSSTTGNPMVEAYLAQKTTQLTFRAGSQDALRHLLEVQGLWEQASGRLADVSQAANLAQIGAAYRNRGQAPQALATLNHAVVLARDGQAPGAEIRVLDEIAQTQQELVGQLTGTLP